MLCVDLNKLTAFKKSLLLLGLSSLAGCQNAEEKASDRLKQGVELFKQGDYQKAQLELKSAIQADGSLASSYYYMALLNEKNRQYKAMKENLAQAVKLDPANKDARLKLGKVSLMFNEVEAALSQASEILTLNAEDLEGLTLKATALIRQKNVPEALAIIEGILQKNPQYSSASALKAVTLIDQKEFDQALTLVNAAIAKDANNLELQLLKVQIDSYRKDIQAIIQDYERLVELQPDSDDLKIGLAKIYILAKRNADADIILAQMVAAHPEKIEPKLLYLDFLNTFDPSKVAGQLDTYIAENQDKKNPTLLLASVQWLIRADQLDTAQTLLEKNLAEDHPPEVSEKLKLSLAELKFNRRNLDGALVLVEEVLAQNSNNQQAKILKAKTYVAQQNYEPAIDIFNKVLWESPELDSVIVMLGEIELLRHDPEKADRKFREALEINPANLNALRPIIKRALAQGNQSYVDELVTKALQFKPDDIVLAEQLARIKMAEKDWNGAKIAIDSLENNPDAQLTVSFLRAKLAQDQDKCPQAITGYKKLLAIAPNNAEALHSLAECHEKLQKRPEMLNFLSTFIQEHPSVIPAYLLKSQLSLLDKNDQDAITTLTAALAADKKHPSIYNAFADFYLRKNDLTNAIKQYQAGLSVVPNNTDLQVRLAQAYEKSNDINKAVETYEMVIAKNPEMEIAINNLVSLLIDHFSDEQSISKAKDLAERFKNTENAYFLDTYGWVQAKAGDIDKAIAILEKVNIMAPEVAIFRYHLGVAHHQQGNNAKAAAQLQEALTLGSKQGLQFTENKQAQQLLEKIKMAHNSN